MEKKPTYEVRSVAEQPVAGEGRTISGYAIVWGVPSRVMWDWEGDFVEYIERGAVDDALIAQSDVKALYNHDRNMLLARSAYGEGTLRLSIDEHGLRFEFEAPETTAGNDVLELVRRGDLKGCSFAFTAQQEDTEYSQEKDERVRRVRKISGLYDVSVVVDPAYTQTSVDARSWSPAQSDAEEQKIKMQQRDAVAKEKAMREVFLRKMEIEQL